MADSNRRTDALLTDHFSYTPLSLIDDIINAVNTMVYRALDAVEDGLLGIPLRQLGFGSGANSSKSSTAETVADEARDEIENGVHQLETLLESTVDKSFDMFELYTLRNILTVPDDLTPWMQLKHYEGLQLPLPQNAPTPESILLLRRKVQETRKLNLALRSTHARNEALISDLTAILSPQTTQSTSSKPSLAFLTHPPTPTDPSLNLSSGTNPLTTHAHFATSQLPALRQLVNTLRPRMEKLRQMEGTGDVDWDSKREGRRRYIEQSAKRVVGREVGLGEIEGERRGREEAEGLEGAVRGFAQGGKRMEE